MSSRRKPGRDRNGAVRTVTAIGGQGGVGKTKLPYYVAREVRVAGKPRALRHGRS